MGLIRKLLTAKAAVINPSTLRNAMFRKIAGSNEILLIRALFELGRFLGIPTDQNRVDLDKEVGDEADDEVDGEADDKAVTLESIFEKLLEYATETNKFELAQILLEARQNSDVCLV